jgi:hypothetical protein
MTDTARTKWKNHVGNSKKKGVLPLTYEGYLAKIREAGIEPSQIGHRIDQFQLARYTDSGDYTADSCRFVTTAINLAEQKLNGGTARMAEKRRGRTKLNCSYVASQAEKMRGRTKVTHPGIAVGSAKTASLLRGRTKETDKGRAAAALKMSKPFAFVDPAGRLHEGVNLNQFCKDMGLLGNAMNKLKTGHLKSYHGWKKA